jgi:hypothetical protein
MARNFHQRRRRPGRRPPAHSKGQSHKATARPRGFTPPGWRQFSNVVLPFKGRDKRLFFNEVSDWIAVAAGLVGALLGWSLLGPIGTIVGLCAGVMLCGQAMEDGRYIRR